jgi:YVTN family beta-propeller protein
VWFATSDDSLWVSSSASSAVYRVDLATEQVTAEIPMAAVPLDLTFAAGYVWVPNRSDGIVSRIDPATNEVTEIVVTSGIYVAEPVGDQVWVLDFAARDVYFIDPALVG